jgi:hypothetical protein
MTQRWEYRTDFLKADAQREEDFLRQYRDWKEGIPPYAVEALMPRLNALGDQGWELVHMQPAFVGGKEDVLMHDSQTGRVWTSSYFCVFKRPVRD